MEGVKILELFLKNIESCVDMIKNQNQRNCISAYMKSGADKQAILKSIADIRRTAELIQT